MALAAVLLARLNEETIPLCKRLCLAKNALQDNSFRIQHKEEIIIKWFCDLNVPKTQSEDVWKALQECLANISSLNIIGSDIRTNVKSLLVQDIQDHMKEVHPSSVQLIGLHCTLNILQTTIFQQHLARNLEELYPLCASFFEALSELEDTDISQKLTLYFDCLNYIISFSKQSSVKGKLNTGFVSCVSASLVKAVLKLQQQSTIEDSTYIEKETLKFVQQVLLPKNCVKDIVSSLSSVFESESCSNNLITETLLYTLLLAREKFSADVVSKLYAIFFGAVVTDTKEDSSGLFQALVVFSFLVGFKPTTMAPLGDSRVQLLRYRDFKMLFNELNVHKPRNVDETSLAVLKGLFDVIITKETNLDAVIKEVTMLKWLQALMLSVVQDNTASERMFEILCCFVHLSPLVVEPIIMDILKEIMFSSKPVLPVMLRYTTFMCTILEMFMKLHRLQKFISKLLTTLKAMFEGPVTSGLLMAEVSDVFPEKFCSQFSKNVLLLPSSQIISMMRTFIYHLKEDCLPKLPACRNDNSCESAEIHTALLSCLLCHFLVGIRLAEHTVINSVRKRFCEALEEMADVLGQFGSAVVQIQHRPRLVVSYLKTCHCWGQLRILLLYYCEDTYTPEISVPHVEDLTATNLTPLHRYLSPDIWALLTQRVINFGEQPCKDILRQLVIQKLHSLLLQRHPVKGLEESCHNVKSYLLSSALECPHLLLERDFREGLLNSGNPEDLMTLAERTVEVFKEDSSLACKLLEPEIQESRPFILTLLWAVLIKTRKCFVKVKRKAEPDSDAAILSLKLARDVLSKIDPLCCVPETDSSSFAETVAKMAALINAYCETEQETVPALTNGLIYNVDLCHLYLKALQKFPLLNMCKEVQSIVLLSTIAILLATEKIYRPTAAEDILLKETCCEILIGLLENVSNIGCHLQLSHIILRVNALSLAPHCTHLRQQLLSSLALQMISGSIEERQLTENLDVLLENSECGSAWEIGTAVLQALYKGKQRHLKPTSRSICKAYRNKLCRRLLDFLKKGNTKKNPELILLLMRSFNLTLTNSLSRNKEKQLSHSVKYLDLFVQNALSSAKNSGPQTEDAIALLSTVLRHRSRLGRFLPADFVTTAWAKVTTDTAVSVDNAQLLLESATLEEYTHIIQSLASQTKTAVALCSSDDIERCLVLWSSVIKSNLSSEKNKIRCTTLTDVLQLLFSFVSLKVPDTCKRDLLKFFEVAINYNKEVQLVPVVLDLCLTIVLRAELSLIGSVSEMVDISDICLQLLMTMMIKWEVHVMDRVPLLLLCVRNLISAIAERADVTCNHEYSVSELTMLATCCHKLEKLVNSMIRHKKHFARVCPYIVADILNIFQKFTIHQAVRMHMMNCVYSFLTLCDSHAVSFLMQILPPAPKEIFKTVHDNFKKHYRFTGKV
ncbi:uncharacterized protein LOC126162321 [Schistocerca cancellata]|uniref:uncharacterized protein LOC126162321 n=1 Tax=Schistocerca cancellata TaxID=274614 RepID=UPI002118B0CC|nr:uncharacterized protein LOC126162321 [Schistocerca cancellata]